MFENIPEVTFKKELDVLEQSLQSITPVMSDYGVDISYEIEESIKNTFLNKSERSFKKICYVCALASCITFFDFVTTSSKVEFTEELVCEFLHALSVIEIEFGITSNIRSAYISRFGDNCLYGSYKLSTLTSKDCLDLDVDELYNRWFQTKDCGDFSIGGLGNLQLMLMGYHYDRG